MESLYTINDIVKSMDTRHSEVVYIVENLYPRKGVRGKKRYLTPFQVLEISIVVFLHETVGVRVLRGIDHVKTLKRRAGIEGGTTWIGEKG